MISASRDRRLTLWKLIDGKVMKKSDYPAIKAVDTRRTGADQGSGTNP